tara:strand:+ start:422 stop:739 length:318 start_codon:yes stop_codon:yes gene_type:complete
MTLNEDFDDIKNTAIYHWPKEYYERTNSSIDLLKQSHNAFIEIFSQSINSPEEWIQRLEINQLSGPLFLKYLMLASDLGGEALNKLTPIKKYFTDSKLNFLLNDK